jgi:inosine-uridine nucleoside N-ribohydrolase
VQSRSAFGKIRGRMETADTGRSPGRERRALIDCDTGTDDAIAIMLAALHPDIELVGVSAVWGNHSVEHTADNSLRVLDHIGHAQVPVHKGAASPFSRAPDAERHRRTLRDELPIPATTRRAGGDAVSWLVETLRGASEPLTLVATGPLTNVAAAVRTDAGVVDAIEELVVMGGGHAFGNVTPSAERNVWNDAQAAAEVLGAGIERVVLVPLDATLDAAVGLDECAELRSAGNAAATAAAALIEQRIGYDGSARPIRGRELVPVHDPLTVAYLIDPSVVELRHVRVEVETQGALTYGRTVMDLNCVFDDPPNAHVALHADRERFHDLLRSTLTGATADRAAPRA